MFGIYLTVIFLAMTAGISNQAFSVLVLLLMCGVPALVYRWLRQVYVRQSGMTNFSALWMEGIATFFFGGVLSSFFAFVYMQALDPGFIERMMRLSIDAYTQNPWAGGEEIAQALQTAVDKHVLPSPISIVFDVMWLIMFTGSLLSMVLAMVVKMRPIKKKNI